MANPKINVKFAIVLHFHQPEGNFEHVFKDAYNNCYLPFLETLQDYPQIKLTLHYSGSLLEWIAKNHPEFLKQISDMVEKGQIEIMTGGFYEPILPIMPHRDRVGQIQLLTDYIKSKIGCKPRGAWIAERVWEPNLVTSLKEAAVEYVILDDTHLLRAGLKKKNTYGYYITQDNKKDLAVFASDKNLRYLIPFKSTDKTLSYIREAALNINNPLFVYADDGEKFGVWPGTHELVHEKRWLRKFFSKLLDNKDWLETVRLSEYMDGNPALGEVVIPDASYDEMMKWASIGKLGKSSNSWRNFFIKYPESNHIYRKMLYISEKINSFKGSNLFKKRISQARRFLYKGQCNCAYWHGLFGGIYSHHLRQTLYKNLIQAETIIDSLLHKRNVNRINLVDFNSDGEKEVISENNNISVYIDPSHGGAITELDCREKMHNFVNTIARRKEVYHDSTGKNLIFDSYRKSCLIDHFFKEKETLKEFVNSKHKQLGGFLNKPYKYKAEKTHRGPVASLERQAEAVGGKFKVLKKITISNRRGANSKVDYVLTNLSNEQKSFYFGVEFNITMPKGPSVDYSYCFLPVLKKEEVGEKNVTKTGILQNINSFGIVDKNKDCDIILSFDKITDVWYYPIYTFAQSEKKSLEKAYQCSTILPHWRLSLKPQEEWKLSIKLEF